MEGIISEVICSDPAVIVVAVEAAGKRRMFRGTNYYRIRYWSIGGAGGENFQPCDAPEFTPLSGGYQGELLGVGMYDKE